MTAEHETAIRVAAEQLANAEHTFAGYMARELFDDAIRWAEVAREWYGQLDNLLERAS